MSFPIRTSIKSGDHRILHGLRVVGMTVSPVTRASPQPAFSAPCAESTNRDVTPARYSPVGMTTNTGGSRTQSWVPS